MTPHRAVIEAGPGVIRRLCCHTSGISDDGAAALGAIDDQVVLVDEQPVAVDALWSATLQTMAGGHRGVVVVHPSWWPASRVAVVTAAARTLSPGDAGDDAGDEVVVLPRSSLLCAASDHQSTVLVEFAEPLVVISGHEVVAVPRREEPRAVAEKVAAVIVTMAQRTVLIDASGAMSGVPQLAALIAGAVTAGSTGQHVTVVDDAGLERLARVAVTTPDERPTAAGARSRGGSAARLVAAGAVVTVAGLAVPVVSEGDPHRTPVSPAAATTVLVEGRVALTIPADWLTQRVLAGPGSARVQITSPSDPEVALHLTQSPTPGETLASAADRLRRAIDAEPSGVFVDFNPAGIGGGRPAVTYREVRAAHDVRWTVLLDGSVRISIGCQSRPAATEAVGAACDQALRTAHAVG